MIYSGVLYDRRFPGDEHRFAPEVRALKGLHGTYALFLNGACMYVGVSSRARLYGTVTRHVQGWGNRKDGTSPGHTFDRFAITAHIQTFEDPADALRAEQVWIAEYGPLLNRQSILPGFEPTQDEIDESEPADLDAAAMDELLSFDV